MKTEKDIDNIFKKGFEHPDDNQGHLADDWEAMEKMLDERKKRPVIIYWLPILGGIAALLMLFIGWWLLRPAANRHQNNQFAVVKDTGRTHTVQNQPAGLASAIKKDTTTPIAGRYPIKKQPFNSINTARVFNNMAQNIYHRSINPFAAASGSDTAKGITSGVKHSDNPELLAYSANAGIVNGPVSDQTIPSVDVLPEQSSNSSVYVKKVIKNKPALAYRPQFALSVLASTDKNGVNSFQQSKAGDNAGLLFSMGLSNKWTISTGLTYTAKQYMTNYAEYHSNYQFAVDPSSVLADCKMFDIPFNIDYLVYHKRNNKLSFGTGISSYIMLHENYQFNFSDNNIGTANYNVPNPNKYLFSIANIQATYTRQVNSKFGITFQPYLKIPLSAVGYSQVHLQTTGVAVGLTWKLNSLSKP